jgi:hypothetical protein
VSCRTAREKRALLRVVRTPAGAVILDPTGRANGRGAYVCRDAACIGRAVGRGGLGRALDGPVPETLEHELRTAAGLADEPAGPSPASRVNHDEQED